MYHLVFEGVSVKRKRAIVMYCNCYGLDEQGGEFLILSQHQIFNPPLISRVAGEIFAVSLGQGRPPPCFLQEWCYHYLVIWWPLKDITKENLHDAELSPLIEKVC